LDRPPYFLIAVSTKENLSLCEKHALAGFTSSVHGAWTYCDIPVGSRVSFLYGAKAYNFYEVKEKFCIEGEEAAFPWGQLTFRSRKTYNFPFRLQLKPVRNFEFGLTSEKFAYVAENLLLRGGYRKTHFQADSNDLGYASELGRPSDGQYEALTHSSPRFQLCFTRKMAMKDPPRVFPVNEIVLQAAIRNYLSDEQRLSEFLEAARITSVPARSFEVLGEKALPQGYVDILLKQANPVDLSRKIPVEIKLRRASAQDYNQLRSYMKEFGKECVGGILIAQDVRAVMKLPKEEGVRCFTYMFDADSDAFTFDSMIASLKLQPHW
jgi:hypothetical protein